MGPADDGQLAQLAVGGDSEAFTELVRRYRDAVYGYCYYRVGSFEDARDLCQETFIIAYTKLRQLREPSKFGAWARTIATNLCAQWRRTRREFPADDITIFETRDESPASAMVREALAGLPDKERLAVVMHYVDGLTYGEVADFLEISEGAVRGRIYRGREALREEVIRMTKDAFEENKLDEQFVIQAVHAALQDSENALTEHRDRDLAQRKMDEAVSLLDQLTGTSEEARRARFDAIKARARLALSLGRGNRIAREYEALKAAEELGDPETLARQLMLTASWEVIERDRERGAALVDRARSIYRELNDPAGLADCDESSAFALLIGGETREAYELYSKVLEALRSVPPDELPGQLVRVLDVEAILRLIRTIGLDTPWDRARAYSAGAGCFTVRNGMIEYAGGTAISGCRERGFHTPRRMPPETAASPGRLLPEVVELGKEWSAPVRGANGRFYDELSRVESVSDTVVAPAGTFRNCVRTVSQTTGPDPDDEFNTSWLLGRRTLWLAPGVGIVKSVYEPMLGAMETCELVDFHIGGQDPGHVPLEVGNRWRYRWVEGEKQHGCKTDDYVEIHSQDEQDAGYVCICYTLCVAADREPAVQR